MRTIRHPIQALSGSKRLMVFGASLVLTLVFGYVLQSLDVYLKTPTAPHGILSFEFSSTVERSKEIVDSWNNAARDSARSSLLLDFLFPVCYSTTLTIACFWAAGLLRERGYRKSGWLAMAIAWMQWPAAAFDYLENVALLVQLRGPIADPWPRIASTSATIKFLLIAAGIVLLIAAFVIWVLRRHAKTASA